jgi:DNA-binding MarR family transcriptional regulator
MSRASIADRIAEECVMRRWRMTNRVLAGIYDEEYRPFGLKSTQLSLLVAVAKAGPVRRTTLGELLSLDPSTLTRNLRVMLRQGWVAEAPDEVDHRGAPLKITAKGARLLESVGPAWQRAQTRAKRVLGTGGVDLLFAMRGPVRANPAG